MTITEAGIGIHRVAVVAGFHTKLDGTIAAACFDTVVEAVIALDPIPIITGFAFLDHPVAAAGALAVVAAVIVVHIVAIIAALTGG